jgi:PhzF family phenazine biosynthesis protein
MKTTVYHVNAFTADSKAGNPAGVVLDADSLSGSEMLAIAKEVGFSETAFVSESDKATKRLRFFTPTEEVDLCGHATIASWSLMYQHNLVDQGISTQETLAGLLKVEVGADGLIFMEQAKAALFEVVESEIVAPILGIKPTDFNSLFKPQVVSTGLKDLIVILNSEDVLNSLVPDFEAMAAFSKDHDITGMHVLCLLDEQPSLAAARNFAPLVGIDEESATGTSNGAFLCYLKRYGSLPAQDQYRIEQGKSIGQTSYIYGRFENDTVWIGGNATVMKEIEISS